MDVLPARGAAVSPDDVPGGLGRGGAHDLLGLLPPSGVGDLRPGERKYGGGVRVVLFFFSRCVC